MPIGQNSYGRVAGPAQRGEGYEAYNVGPTSAEGNLSARELLSYRSALNTLKRAPKMGKRGQLKKAKKTLFQHNRAIGTIENLRQKAAGRAFENVAKTNMQFSKPWLRQAPQGLLTEEVAEHSLANTASMGGAYQPLARERETRGEAMMGTRTFGAVGMPAGGGIHQRTPVDMGFPSQLQRTRESVGQGFAGYVQHKQLGGG